MNSAKFDRSDRLGRVHRLLVARGPEGATSWDIVGECGVVAPSTVVSELRHNGIPVDCRFEKKTEDGRRVYRYTLPHDMTRKENP